MRLMAAGMCISSLFSVPVLASELIVNDSVSQVPATATELRLIFSRKVTYWPDGQPIKVFVLPPDSPHHRAFCIELLDILPYTLQSHWDRLVYSGTGDRPNIVSTDAQMRELVSATPGAIGYLSTTSANQGELHGQNP
jgi:ABC-type phosphate transport system substrate-binding protein